MNLNGLLGNAVAFEVVDDLMVEQRVGVGCTIQRDDLLRQQLMQ